MIESDVLKVCGTIWNSTQSVLCKLNMNDAKIEALI